MESQELESKTYATISLILLTLFVYAVYLFWSKSTARRVFSDRPLLLRASKITESSLQDYTTCKSPECVRCQKYKIIKDEAQERLKKFKEFSGESGLDRISASVHDLKSLPKEPLQDPNVLYVPGLRSQPFWNGSQEFQRETNLLERQWGFISQEFESVYRDSASGWNRNSTESGAWSVFYFYNQGRRVDRNCQRCPRTAALVESMSSFMRPNIFANAMFSVLDPGTVISAHCGPCNIRVRCHLGLAVPSKKTTITVGGQTQSYSLGCCIYMDDSFVHSSLNSASAADDDPRVVLLFDLWHPDLTMKERDALNFIFPGNLL